MKIRNWGALALLSLGAFSHADTYSTGFESPEGFTVGNVNGQGGWSMNGNANHYGQVSTSQAFSGSQSLELRTRDTQAEQTGLMGVIDGLRSPLVMPAGESVGTVNGPATFDRWNCSFWFRTPDAQIGLNTSSSFEDPYGGIVELNPSFSNGSGGSRYANLALYDVGQDQSNYWLPEFGLSSGLILDLYSYSDASTSGDAIAAANLAYATWYRVDMSILFADGLAGSGGNNDAMTVSVFDASNALLGTAVGSTWEYGFRNASWGTGGPMALDSFSVRSMRDTANVNLGYIDGFQMESVPEPATLSVIGLVALAGLRKRKSQK